MWSRIRNILRWWSVFDMNENRSHLQNRWNGKSLVPFIIGKIVTRASYTFQKVLVVLPQRHFGICCRYFGGVTSESYLLIQVLVWGCRHLVICPSESFGRTGRLNVCSVPSLLCPSQFQVPVSCHSHGACLASDLVGCLLLPDPRTYAPGRV